MLIAPAKVKQHWPLILTCSLLLLLASIVVALIFGAVALPPRDIALWIFSGEKNHASIIIANLRLPRALLAACVGALLACSGAVTQGLFRNPLADPSLIGVSAGAAAGASCVIVLLNDFQWYALGLSLVSIGAFIGAIVSVAFVYRLATGPSGTSVATMLLAGIAITFIAGSISHIFEFIADNEMLRRISLWRMGGLDAADHSRVLLMLAVTTVILIILPKHYSALNALLLGESEARHLGINVNHVKKIIILCVAAAVGTSVALAGTISFIGLVVPHIVRIVIGPNHRFLIPTSACVGALLLVMADTFARTIIAPTELPVGLVTAILGAPVFISLLRRRHQYGMQ